jgi:hypothetical protein
MHRKYECSRTAKRALILGPGVVWSKSKKGKKKPPLAEWLVDCLALQTSMISGLLRRPVLMFLRA